MRDDAGVALAPDPPATEAVKPQPEVVFARVFRRLGLKRPMPEFQVQFFRGTADDDPSSRQSNRGSDL